jgi:hypothetical protein
MNYLGYLSDPTPVLSQSVKGWDTSKSYSLTFYYNLDVFDYADHCTLSVMLGENALTPYLLLERANSQAGTWRRWTIPYFSATSVEEKLSFRFECVPIEPKDRYQADMVSYLYLDDLSVSLNKDQSPFG